MRLDKDQWAIQLALVTAKRATCYRRSVGCVLLNARGHVLATGYNGVASGQRHCNEVVVHPNMEIEHGKSIPVTSHPYACPGAYEKSGTNLEGCQAIHAEQNALLQCRDTWEVHTCYVTASPCITCVKLLLNTTCERIVFRDAYPHEISKQLWTQAGRTWQQLDVMLTMS